MSVNRFDFELCEFKALGDMTLMVESDSGDYVTFDDYETLASEYDALMDKYKALVDKLGEMYREG